MARNTSFILGEHFDAFVHRQVRSGRYASAADVVRTGLRLLEEHEQKREALQRALIEGEQGALGPLDMSRVRREARQQAGLPES